MNKRAKTLPVLILLIFSIIVILAQEAQAASWLTGWSYQKSHVINSSSGAGTDYQVKITAHYGSGTDSGEDVYLNNHSRLDFGDVRFTDDDGITQLDYWIEEMPVKNFASNGVSQPLNFINYPSAVYYNNKTYIAWGGGDANGDPYITYYNHISKSWGPIVKIADSPLTNDDHGAPAIAIDANGYLHVFYGSHNSAQKHAKSDNPRDISAWTVQADVDDAATYPKAIIDGSNMYVFYRRDNIGTYNNPFAYRKSSDNGATWGPENTIINFGENTRIYPGHVELNNGKIHFTWSLYTPSSAKRKQVYYAYLNTTDENVYSINGINLGKEVTKLEADTYCLVVDTGNDESNHASLHVDSNGYPWIVYIRGSGTNWTYYHTRWNGTSWTTPASITTTGNGWDYADFIIDSVSDVTAYLTTAGLSLSTKGGDIEKWHWDGNTWSKVQIVLTEAESGKPLNAPMIPVNFNPELQVIFSQMTEGDYTSANFKMYAYSGTDFVRTAAGYAVFWVKVADDLETANRTIYMYYSKSDATYPLGDDQAQMDNTFIFADNFYGTSINGSKWNYTTGVSVADSIVSIAGSGLWNSRGIGSIATFDRSVGLMYNFKYKGSGKADAHHSMLGYGPYPLDYTKGWYFYVGTSGWDWNEYINSVSGDYVTTFLRQTWYRANLYLKPIQGYTALVNSFQEKDSATYNTTGYKLVVQQSRLNENSQLDWVFVRKYVNPEPSHGVWGSEEIEEANPLTFTVTPEYESLAYEESWSGVTFEAEDPLGINYWWVNDTTNFVINQTGFLNWTSLLEVNDYYVNVSVNDTLGNTNSVIYNLNVTKRNIEITADNKEKTYGDSDPSLTYLITSGSLAYNDSIIGGLARDSGENVGTYKIIQGNLSIDNIENYNLSFINGTFTINDLNATGNTILVKMKTGKYTGNGDLITINLGFSPQYIKIYQSEQGDNLSIGEGETTASDNNYTYVKDTFDGYYSYNTGYINITPAGFVVGSKWIDNRETVSLNLGGKSYTYVVWG